MVITLFNLALHCAPSSHIVAATVYKVDTIVCGYEGWLNCFNPISYSCPRYTFLHCKDGNEQTTNDDDDDDDDDDNGDDDDDDDCDDNDDDNDGDDDDDDGDAMMIGDTKDYCPFV